MGCKLIYLLLKQASSKMGSYHRYTIRRYSLKLDETTEVYCLELMLDRVDGQKPLELLKHGP